MESIKVYENITNEYIPKLGYKLDSESKLTNDQISQLSVSPGYFAIKATHEEDKKSKLVNVVIIDLSILTSANFKSMCTHVFGKQKTRDLSSTRINIIKPDKVFTIRIPDIKFREIPIIKMLTIPYKHVSAPKNIKLIKKDSPEYKCILKDETIANASQLNKIPVDDNLCIWLDAQIGDIISGERITSSDYGYSLIFKQVIASFK